MAFLERNRENEIRSTIPEPAKEVRGTAYSWLIELRTFFSDICAWATEPDSPFAPFAPRTIPITRHTLLGHGFEKGACAYACTHHSDGS